MKTIKRIYRTLPEGRIKNLLSGIYNRRSKISKVPNLPSYVQIEPTTRCNLNCVMCMREDFLKSNIMKNGDMNFEDFKKILNKLPSTEEIDLQGVGEPFLNKDIFKMIRYAKEKGIRMHTVTNATLIGNMAEDIVNSGLDLLKISFYGASPRIYEKIMRNSDMKKVVNNIKKLDQTRKRLGSKKPILELTIGAMHENIRDLLNIPEIAKEIGIDKLIVGEIYGYGKPLIMTKEVSQILEDVKNKCKELDLKVVINLPSKVYDYTKVCLWPWVATYITWDGFVKPCCSRPYFVNLKLGNILEEEFEKIWKNEKYIRFRTDLKSKDVPLMCKGCQYDFSAFGVNNEK